jgi:hypothetical protein
MGASPRAAAQAVAPDAVRKSLRAQQTLERPVIDGVLSEELWARAPVVDDFHQVTPAEFAEPSERTEVYVLYDSDALYIAARL